MIKLRFIHSCVDKRPEWKCGQQKKGRFPTPCIAGWSDNNATHIIKGNQISPNIIKYHQISSNIIKYHQISSNIRNRYFFCSSSFTPHPDISNSTYRITVLHPSETASYGQICFWINQHIKRLLPENATKGFLFVFSRWMAILKEEFEERK